MPPPSRRTGVYVLRLKQDDHYYVGSSHDIDSRIASHMKNPKVAWVAARGGVSEVIEPITPREDPLSAWEMRETLARMIMHGFNKVRGWEYCSPYPLTDSDVDGIFKIMCGGHSEPLCRSCGFPGHMASTCTTEGRATWMENLMACRPARRITGSEVIFDLINNGGTVAKSQRRFVSYDELSDVKKRTRRDYSSSATSGEGCARCGRTCHTEDRCYARTSVTGDALQSSKDD